MNIKTGYYNWNEFGLNDSFYPEDMPEEWRLTFYANEIECTQISLSGLKDLDDAEELFEDLTDQFDLIVSCDDVEQWPLINKLLENEELSIKGLVCSSFCYQQYIDRLKSYSVPCFIDNDQQAIAFVSDINAKQLVRGDLSIVYLDELLSLKQLRLFIDQWIEDKQYKEYYLLLNSNVYKSSAAGEMRIMIEMMGH